MKYALTAAVTFILALLIVIGYLLAQMMHSNLKCEFRTTFNQSEVVMQVAEGLPQGVEGSEQSSKSEKGKKVPPPSLPAGIKLSGKGN